MQDPDQASFEQIIGERYALYGPIASGGMATVHFGRQLGAGGFSRTVAIKRLRGEFLESFEVISTLLDEARLASRIRHPNVVATLDMVSGDGEVFLVMEYVVGESLARLLAKLDRRKERVAPKIATGILCGVLHALHAAHEAVDEHGEPLGIVHRDVSPQNVLVGTDGLARLLDFGIAKGKGRLQTTRAGQLKGKVSYMAPEQILGEEPDRRSDIYAAAVVLWEVLTGRRLFPTDVASDNYSLIPKILEADVEPPSAVAEVPSALDAIVMRGLNRHREARYRTAREFAVALEDTVGLATNRQIGEWVAEIAERELAERAELVKALEAVDMGSDRRSAIADEAAARQRRKRLGSRDPVHRDKRRRPDPRSKPRFDEPTEVDDETEDTTAKRHTPQSLRELVRKREQARARDAAEVKTLKDPRSSDSGTSSEEDTLDMRGGDSDREDLRQTTHWRRGDTPHPEKRGEIRDEPSEGEMITSVHSPSALLKGPPKLPGSREEEADDETMPSATPDDVRVPSHRAIPSDIPPSGTDEIVLPVRSNRWIMVVLVIAALVVGGAAAFKMMTP